MEALSAYNNASGSVTDEYKCAPITGQRSGTKLSKMSLQCLPCTDTCLRPLSEDQLPLRQPPSLHTDTMMINIITTSIAAKIPNIQSFFYKESNNKQHIMAEEWW